MVEVGGTVKHYRIEAVLGRGGMGVVYRGRDSRLDRPVALKFLPTEFTADPDRKRRFFQEARAASAVNHPAIAQVYDVDEDEGAAFIVMELVEGKTVRTLIQGRELDLLGALEIAAQVAAGLAKAHEAGIVHRDIKAENVMVTPDGHAKILDFGLAKLLEPPSGPDGPAADELSHMETLARTQAGVVVGTLRYMSPEQARGQPVDHRSDVFSLGVVLYEMVTGQLPFSGGSPVDLLHSIAFDESRPVTALRPHLPSSLQRVITRCLRKRREDRYPDARELAGDLRVVQREVESGVSGATPLKDRVLGVLRSVRDLSPRRWAWPAIGVLAAAALVLVVATSRDWPAVVFPIVIPGLFVYRRIRHRHSRLMRRFAAKVRKVPEVRLVLYSGLRVTVVVDKAIARTYLRVNAALDAVNGRMFFGDPFTLEIREEVRPEEVRALLAGSGVLFVRDDVLEARA
jgi:predicted Ser/Thr protein kinase